ncbi:MAG: adenine deaminase [Bacteroidales bacterium]|nr:adenine deaminase [Bacteroidales bacterium]
MKIVEGKIVDVLSKRIFEGKVSFENGKIVDIEECSTNSDKYILPGLVDSHIHIESSMVTPQRFAEAALKHGVVSIIADPHEISNVLDTDGFNFMLKDAKKSPMKIYFGVPSCVPATNFETSGAVLNSSIVSDLLKNDHVVALAEMMNFPGVIFKDPEVLAKIKASKDINKPIDGHAPGLDENQNKQYIEAGISTDHECSNLDEARIKIKYGMKIQIREGSAAKNMLDLAPLYKENPDSLMLCSDDFHPDDLSKSYMFERISKLISLGYDFFDVLRSATIIPVQHYKLNVGLLQKGDNADFVVVDNIKDFQVNQVYLDGKLIVDNGVNQFQVSDTKPINNFICKKITSKDIEVPYTNGNIQVIEAIDKSLLTNKLVVKPLVQNGLIVTNTKTDILKIVVLNRYKGDSKPSVGFIKGFKLKFGAVASCIAHDSHNIICVGVDDESIVKSINQIIKNRGGLVVCTGLNLFDMKLEIGGIMSNVSCETAGISYSRLSLLVKSLGCSLTAPFMTLSFMALPVIPSLKITDKGLFDVEKFDFTSVLI